MNVSPKQKAINLAGKITIGVGVTLAVVCAVALIWSLFRPPVTNGPEIEVPGWENK